MPYTYRGPKPHRPALSFVPVITPFSNIQFISYFEVFFLMLLYSLHLLKVLKVSLGFPKYFRLSTGHAEVSYRIEMRLYNKT